MSKFKQQFLAGPYLIWIIGFIILPMVMILYYAFTNSNGSFTVEYIAAIATETNRKAIFLSLKLGVICTLVCLVLSYPLAMILNNMQIKNQGLVVFIFRESRRFAAKMGAYAAMLFCVACGNAAFRAIMRAQRGNDVCFRKI